MRDLKISMMYDNLFNASVFGEDSNIEFWLRQPFLNFNYSLFWNNNILRVSKAW